MNSEREYIRRSESCVWQSDNTRVVKVPFDNGFVTANMMISKMILPAVVQNNLNSKTSTFTSMRVTENQEV